MPVPQVASYLSHRPWDAIFYVVAGSPMAIFYAHAINELILVTSSLTQVTPRDFRLGPHLAPQTSTGSSMRARATQTVLGSIKHVVMAMVSAICIDHLILQGDRLGLTVMGLLGFVPAVSAYSYLMLSHSALEASSWTSDERSCVESCCDFDFLFQMRHEADGKAAGVAHPTLAKIGTVSSLLDRKQNCSKKLAQSSENSSDFL